MNIESASGCVTLSAFRRFASRRPIFLALFLIIGLGVAPARAAPVLSFNAGMTADQNFLWGPSDAGWFYTPNASFDLAGIATSFAAFGGASRDVTVGLYSGLPSLGGDLLGAFSLATNRSPGVWVSGSFAAPIALAAGQSYFIDFSHLGALNILAPAPGASPFAFNPAGAFVSNFYFDQLTATPGMDPGQTVFSEALLQFLPASSTGAETVPEPASLALLAMGLFIFGIARRSAGLGAPPPAESRGGASGLISN